MKICRCRRLSCASGKATKTPSPFFIEAKHKRQAWSLCLKITKNEAVAEDLVQDVFLKLFRKIHTFRGEAKFSTWFHKLALREVLMYLRKQKLKTTSLDEIQEPVAAGEPRRDFGYCDRNLAGSIDRVNLDRAIEELPGGYRLMFVLHDIEGYEHNEIAEILGCSIGNSKSQLHRARMRLRLILQGEPKPAS